METCNQPWRREEIGATEQIRFGKHEDDRKLSKESGFSELGDCSGDGDGIGGVARVKIVLTREELEWLMLQLSDSSNSKGGVGSMKRSLEEILGEIERGRTSKSSSSRTAEAAAWRPSLESIMEIPDVPDHMDGS